MIELSPFALDAPSFGIPDGFALSLSFLSCTTGSFPFSLDAEPLTLANASLAALFAGAESLLPVGRGGLGLGGAGHVGGFTPSDELLLDPPARGGVDGLAGLLGKLCVRTRACEGEGRGDGEGGGNGDILRREA